MWQLFYAVDKRISGSGFELDILFKSLYILTNNSNSNHGNLVKRTYVTMYNINTNVS